MTFVILELAEVGIFSVSTHFKLSSLSSKLDILGPLRYVTLPNIT